MVTKTLRQFSFDQLAQGLAIELSEEQLIRRLKAIHSLYTSQRQSLAKASSLELEDCAAYAHFYLPANYAKLDFLFRQLPPNVHEALAATTLVDVGTGPGTFSLAWHDHFATPGQSPESFAIEVNPAMATLASRLMAFFHPAASFHVAASAAKLSLPATPLTVLFGNSFNEMGLEQVNQLLADLRPRFVIFIEPGTPEVFDNVMRWRMQNIGQRFQCLYPCPLKQAPCPLQIQNDWCHQLLRYQPDPWQARMARILEIDRYHLPLLAHVYVDNEGGADLTTSLSLGRSVRFLGDHKHAISLRLCTSQHEALEIRDVEFLKRSLNKSQQEMLLQHELGSNVAGDWLRPLNEDQGRWRAQLNKSEEQ